MAAESLDFCRLHNRPSSLPVKAQVFLIFAGIRSEPLFMLIRGYVFNHALFVGMRVVVDEGTQVTRADMKFDLLGK